MDTTRGSQPFFGTPVNCLILTDMFFFLNGIFDNISDVKRLNLLYVLCKFTITLNYIVCRTLSLHVNNKLQLGSPPRYNLPLKHLQV